MEMGKEIRRLRMDRGLTQEALANALNVTAQSVSKWECGTSVPDVQLLPEIAVYFGVTIDQLFAMDPEQQMERIENLICVRPLIVRVGQCRGKYPLFCPAIESERKFDGVIAKQPHIDTPSTQLERARSCGYGRNQPFATRDTRSVPVKPRLPCGSLAKY